MSAPANNEPAAGPLLGQIPEPAVVADADGVILAANRAAALLFFDGLASPVGHRLGDWFTEPFHFSDPQPEPSFQVAPDADLHLRERALTLKGHGYGRRVLLTWSALYESGHRFIVTIRDISTFAEREATTRLFADLLESGLKGAAPPEELLERLCLGLAEALGLKCVAVAQQRTDGVLAPVVTSDRNALWEALAQIPERVEGQAASKGPGATALRKNAAVTMRIEDPHFLPWRAAAESCGVRSLGAWPLAHAGHPRRVLLLFSARGETFESPGNRQWLGALVERIGKTLVGLMDLEQLRVTASALESAGNAAFITDLAANIVWANAAFLRLTGYSREQVIGQNPRMLKSGKQGPQYYERLWRSLHAGEAWTGDTVDRDREGRLYTIRQTVSPVFVRGVKTHYVSIHEDISREKSAEAERERAIAVDPISGLSTRAVFREAFEQAATSKPVGAATWTLLRLSLPGYAALSETLGEQAGNQLLHEIGRRIAGVLEHGDTATHLGRSEFALLLKSAAETADAQAAADQLLRALEQPYPWLGESVNLAPRVGIAAFPADGADADAVLFAAEGRLTEVRVTHLAQD